MTGQQLSQQTIGKKAPLYKFHEKINLDNGKFMYIPKRLKQDLMVFIDDMMYEEMDILICIDGKEGTGKSRDARIIGKFISSYTGVTFNPKNIHLTTEDYMKSSENGCKFQVNVLDESRQALNRKRAMSKSNVKFTNWLSENRDKQQVHIIILPAIHDLESYITMWRMSLLIHKLKGHVKANNRRSGYKLARGFFKVYENTKTLQQVLFNKTKYGYYSYPKEYKYRLKMLNCEPFTDLELKEYKDKKAEKRREKYVEVEKKKTMSQLEKSGLESTYKMIKAMREDNKQWSEIGELMGISANGAQMKFTRFEKALTANT